jgi:hypothetical protein
MPVLAKLAAAYLTAGDFLRAIELKAGLARRICVGPYGRFAQLRHRSRTPWAALLAADRWARVYREHLDEIAAPNPAAPPRVAPAKLRERRA